MLDEILKCYKNDIALASVSVLTMHLDEIIELCDNDYLIHRENRAIILDSVCAILQAAKHFEVIHESD